MIVCELDAHGTAHYYDYDYGQDPPRLACVRDAQDRSIYFAYDAADRLIAATGVPTGAPAQDWAT